MVIAILGAYGAHKESKVSLIVVSAQISSQADKTSHFLSQIEPFHQKTDFRLTWFCSVPKFHNQVMSDVSDGKNQSVIIINWSCENEFTNVCVVSCCEFGLHLQNWSSLLLLLFTSWPELLESSMNLNHFWFCTFETSESAVFWSCSETLWCNLWFFDGWLCKCGLSLVSSSVPGVYGDRMSADAPDRDPRRHGPAQGNTPTLCCGSEHRQEDRVTRRSSDQSKLSSVYRRVHFSWRGPPLLSCRQIESMLMLMLTQLLLLRHIKRLQLDKHRLAFIVKQQQEMQKTRRQTFCWRRSWSEDQFESVREKMISVQKPQRLLSEHLKDNKFQSAAAGSLMLNRVDRTAAADRSAHYRSFCRLFIWLIVQSLNVESKLTSAHRRQTQTQTSLDRSVSAGF